MRVLLYLFTLAVIGSARAATDYPEYDLDRADEYFEQFLLEHNKQYKNDLDREMHFENFKEHLVSIMSLNNASQYAVYDINKFSDLDKFEFLEAHTGLLAWNRALTADNETDIDQYRLCETVVIKGPAHNVPDSFDWRNFHKVTEVKEQGVCGSCWAFAAIGNIESQYAIKHNRLLNLAEQQLLDCDQIDQGCNGGLMHLAFQEIIRMGGVESEASYPYRGIEYACRSDRRRFDVSLSNCYRYDLRDERKLRELLHRVGPIAVAIDCVDIIDYHRGIATVCNNNNGLNHAVLLVGYGVENDTPYWIFKNSWGTNWGENGYFRAHRNINACGLLNDFAASAVLQ